MICLFVFQLQLKHAVTIAEVNQLKERVSLQRMLLLGGSRGCWLVWVFLFQLTNFTKNRLNAEGSNLF